MAILHTSLDKRSYSLELDKDSCIIHCIRIVVKKKIVEITFCYIKNRKNNKRL